MRAVTDDEFMTLRPKDRVRTVKNARVPSGMLLIVIWIQRSNAGTAFGRFRTAYDSDAELLSDGTCFLFPREVERA